MYNEFWAAAQPVIFRARVFQVIGVDAKDRLYWRPQFISLASLVIQNKHAYIDTLKTDMEGSKYVVMDG